VRGKAFHGERSGDANLFPVLIGLVVKVFVIGLGSDGGVDFLLPGDALLPPLSMERFGFLRPFLLGLAGDFPFLPGFAKRLVELLTERLQGPLELFPDHVDFGVVGNGFQGDVRNSFINEPLTNAPMGRYFGGRLARELGLLELAVPAVGQQVIGVASSHDAGTGQGKSDAGSINGDPPTAPLFGDIGGGSRATGGVEDKVARIGGHEGAAFNHTRVCLDDIGLVNSIKPPTDVCPKVRDWDNGIVVKKTDISEAVLA